MEEQVIQETPVATPDQPVAGADTAPQIDQSAQLRAEYESQIAAFKAQAAEAATAAEDPAAGATQATVDQVPSLLLPLFCACHCCLEWLGR